MEPRHYLRVEGAVIGVAALGLFLVDTFPLWWLVFALAPDLGMVGYLKDEWLGALLYNVAHVYVLPFLLGAAGIFFNSEPMAGGGLLWVAHIGVDRAAGYGLKEKSGFKDTHLG